VRAVVEELRNAVPGPNRPWIHARVRPRPAFVLRTVLLAFAVAGGLAAAAFGARGSIAAWYGGIGAAVVALAAGVIVADSLRQETTTNYPLPRSRAAGYGLASTVVLAGLGAASIYLPDRRLAWLVGGAVVALAGALLFTYLGVTQTNRHKPWAVRHQNQLQEAGDRFTRDPAAAARFGLYTVIIWIVTLTVFGVLSFTIGWAWSWLALVAGLVLFLLTLTRMLFGAEASTVEADSRLRPE
jgi:hypothetical protein